jgi:hypothetical protein
MDIDYVQDAELDALRIRLARMEGRNKRKSAKGSFSVKKKLRVAPITKRMRSTGVTPRTAKKSDTRTSRSHQMQPRKIAFGSGTNSRSNSRPPLSQQGKMEQFLKGNKAMYNLLTPSSKKKVSFATTLKSRKVRHNNARKVLNKMPAGGKPYARRRMTSRKPKGAYRGAVMPRWAKGETKHILAGDGCDEDIATQTNTALTGTATGISSRDKHKEIVIGNAAHFSLNPIAQGSGQYQRNGRSVDGTYLRIQGHIFNAAGAHSSVGTDDNVGGAGTNQKAYVRMLVLAVKGNTNTGGSGLGPSGGVDVRGKAPLIMSNLFKRIDGSITGFTAATNETSAVASVRTLQLPVNKALYTVLADQKMQLASTNESFGSSDRLFDLKIPLKQKSVWASAEADTFEKNQLVFVVMTVDPSCNNTIPTEKIHLEFESKYSYKDF